MGTPITCPIGHSVDKYPWNWTSSRGPYNIDHLVVGPGGIFLIDSKNYHSWVYWVDGDGCRFRL
jgi:hypothetical protein